MPRYARFIKEQEAKKRENSFEDVGRLHHCIEVTSKSLAQKNGDPEAFTIPYTIGASRYTKVLYDLEASTKLMLMVVFRQLGLSPPKPTTMQLLMADFTVKKLVGISFDMLLKVDNFIFRDDFVILDSEVDYDMPIILGRPFMSKGIAMVDMEKWELKFRVNNEEVKFNVQHENSNLPTSSKFKPTPLIVIRSQSEDPSIPAEPTAREGVDVGVGIYFEIERQSEALEISTQGDETPATSILVLSSTSNPVGTSVLAPHLSTTGATTSITFCIT
ncbi:uncharacterized protein LOC124885718 [Capsicum annuum]|uniref:uncharacterized protein LOC124885718 n=1 Tax=Capsicum annuum TaxID=4072 RepID=UPI001FB0A28F|nr:uncharacterized protein LOC124885718 [Capsicum annuum]